MYAVILFLCPEAAWPPPHALGRFPSWSDACTQAERCRLHLAVLSDARRLHGYQGGLWDAALVETAARLDYWSRLALCHQCETEVGLLRRRLQGLRERIGPERFLAGWSPDRLPEPPRPAWRATNAAGD